MIQHATRTVKGRDRSENRDCAEVQIDEVRSIFVIVDGTSKPGSEILAPALVKQIVTEYRARIEEAPMDLSHKGVDLLLTGILHAAHASLFSGGICGSASYLVAVIFGGFITIAYEGDCSAGVASSVDSIIWFTPPHCLANWRRDRDHRQLAMDLGRHSITRSFKARKLPDPEFMTRPIVRGETLVFATDGFWADLSDSDQLLMLDPEKADPSHVDDDVTWIVVKT